MGSCFSSTTKNEREQDSASSAEINFSQQQNSHLRQVSDDSSVAQSIVGAQDDNAGDESPALSESCSSAHTPSFKEEEPEELFTPRAADDGDDHHQLSDDMAAGDSNSTTSGGSRSSRNRDDDIVTEDQQYRHDAPGAAAASPTDDDEIRNFSFCAPGVVPSSTPSSGDDDAGGAGGDSPAVGGSLVFAFSSNSKLGGSGEEPPNLNSRRSVSPTTPLESPTNALSLRAGANNDARAQVPTIAGMSQVQRTDSMRSRSLQSFVGGSSVGSGESASRCGSSPASSTCSWDEVVAELQQRHQQHQQRAVLGGGVESSSDDTLPLRRSQDMSSGRLSNGSGESSNGTGGGGVSGALGECDKYCRQNFEEVVASRSGAAGLPFVPKGFSIRNAMGNCAFGAAERRNEQQHQNYDDNQQQHQHPQLHHQAHFADTALDSRSSESLSCESTPRSLPQVIVSPRLETGDDHQDGVGERDASIPLSASASSSPSSSSPTQDTQQNMRGLIDLEDVGSGSVSSLSRSDDDGAATDFRGSNDGNNGSLCESDILGEKEALKEVEFQSCSLSSSEELAPVRAIQSPRPPSSADASSSAPFVLPHAAVSTEPETP